MAASAPAHYSGPHAARAALRQQLGCPAAGDIALAQYPSADLLDKL